MALRFLLLAILLRLVVVCKPEACNTSTEWTEVTEWTGVTG